MQSTSAAPSETESSTRRRVIGFFMFPVALFPLLALCSYDWASICDLRIPAAVPTHNLIGMAGDWFAYTGYQLIGLGVWSVPVLCVYIGFRLVLGKTFHPGRRTLGVTLFIFSVTCLLQVADSSPIVPPSLRDLILRIQRDLNIEPNAGGAVGYLVMTRCLAYHLAPFGASVLMFILVGISLLVIAGPRNIISAIAQLTDWVADRRHPDDLGDASDPDSAAEAARAAKEAALAARLAEKERIAQEKADAQAAKEAAREAERQAREERKAAKEAERAAREAEREAAKRAREEQRLKEEQERAALRARLKAERDAPVDYLPPRETPAPRPAAVPVRTAAVPQPVPAPASAEPAAANMPAAEVRADKGPYIVPATDLLNAVQKSEGGPGENVAAMA
ncbi:MAG: DNA translocase FtsK 4TM domain-containing protein, partial [Kiritimatiellae bacterium]|nr:DNA translocase FtsK 4TM domain-containing protein [Kiritimatiellia bacterium]